MRPRSASFDDLVGAGEEQRRNRQAERFGGLEIDDQLELGRLLHRQIARFGTLEYPSDVNAGLAEGSGDTRSKADQAAGRDEFTERIDRRNGMARCQRRELLDPAAEERIADDGRARRHAVGRGSRMQR